MIRREAGAGQARLPGRLTGRRFPRANLLASVRIRVKLIVLHTVFSLLLAGVLWLALRPAIGEVIRQAETHEAGVVLSIVLRGGGVEGAGGGGGGGGGEGGVEVRRGAEAEAMLDPASLAALRAGTGAGGEGAQVRRVRLLDDAGVPVVAGVDPRTAEVVSVRVVLEGARDAVGRLYLLLAIALGLVYVLVAAALEVFVLPQHVYGPIRTMLQADLALRENRRDQELIPPAAIPADELGEIMLSRNESVLALRQHEQDLAEALEKLETVATDLARKNHLLETARRNMAECDRLASLGLMSAGIAHELNTPLAVLKGLVEKLQAGGGGVRADEAALMLRVVGRLERLSESLLDFARVRPGRREPVRLGPLVDEAWTLVRLDRDAAGVEMTAAVPDDLHASCDADRIVQVLVNLLRNAVDAMASAPTEARPGDAGRRRISVVGRRVGGAARDGVATGDALPDACVSLSVADSGPGIDAALMSRLFEPFVTTRLDARGTGLGLAVAEGIVKEHGGRILARNRPDGAGAVFEIILPAAAGPRSGREAGVGGTGAGGTGTTKLVDSARSTPA